MCGELLIFHRNQQFATHTISLRHGCFFGADKINQFCNLDDTKRLREYLVLSHLVD